MKHVRKAEPPPEFQAWKAQANDNWQPTYGTLQNPLKRVLHTALLTEQGWVCCYCGREVQEDLSDSHIEHFRPQESHGHLALSYENLHASCIRGLERPAPDDPNEPRRRVPVPVHCGHAKGGNFDEAQHLSPLDSRCEARFVYTLTGQIAPADPADARADYMIGLLALDIAFLRNRRQEAVSRVFDADFLQTVTQKELMILRERLHNGDAEGIERSFRHVVARFTEQRLAEHAQPDEVPDSAPASASHSHGRTRHHATD